MSRSVDNAESKTFPTSDVERWRVSQSKRACVDAAQQTARLLHNIEDKKSLIFGFPWWQMISCLICASSILLVARVLLEHDQLVGKEGLDWTVIEEDAELCLHIFEVLSTNSKAAQLARDMMEGLKETRGRSRSDPDDEPIVTALPSAMCRQAPDFWSLAQYELEDQRGLGDFEGFAMGISEPVVWSAQFVDAAYNPFLGYSSTIV